MKAAACNKPLKGLDTRHSLGTLTCTCIHVVRLCSGVLILMAIQLYTSLQYWRRVSIFSQPT